jgi:hypothetical protein
VALTWEIEMAGGTVKSRAVAGKVGEEDGGLRRSRATGMKAVHKLDKANGAGHTRISQGPTCYPQNSHGRLFSALIMILGRKSMNYTSITVKTRRWQQSWTDRKTINTVFVRHHI